MADRMAAEIWIGGTIPPALIAPLCEAITSAGVSLDWGERLFEPKSAQELLAARIERDGVELLWLCDDQARWGQMEDLEEFLQAHQIPFTRRTEGKYEYDPELVDFRPGLEPRCRPPDMAGEPVVTVSELDKVCQTLRRFRTDWPQREPEKAAAALERVLEQLDGYRGDLPSLPGFVIAAD